ncbi:zinc finger protein 585A-like [Bombina bombina]|uniref:zinc finger protein 585A-like n=1 Tax=Bombina bombina TaxID=8345 RepID=UPI00235A6788|nr:zinc finger protein 585A-like [Bombina bombina]
MFGQSTEDDTIKFIIKDCGEEHISLQRDPDAYESDGETCADDFTETNFLRIIKVEETDEDYFTESEVKQSMTGELVASPDRNDKGSAELQEEGVYPLALLTTDSQFAFIGEGRFIVQPCEETSRVDSSVLQFAEEDQYCATSMNKDLETLDELRKNDPPRPKRTYSCSMCCKSFLYKLNLEVHERLHAHQASFICLRCDKTFRRKQNLLQHQKKHHPKEDALQYDLHTSLEHNDSAEVPLSHHEGLRQFECTECGRRFKQRIGLIRHQKTHRQDKLPSKYVAPPPKKIYRLPCTQAASTGKKGEPTATEDAYSQLHRHLQLSTAFLQDLITSTSSFQYD